MAFQFWGFFWVDRSNASGIFRILFWRDIAKETELNHTKGDFLAPAAHALRTPLASIFGFSELLLQRKPNENAHAVGWSFACLYDRSAAESGREVVLMNFSVKYIFRRIAGISLFLFSIATQAAVQPDEITVGVVPQQAATALAKVWVPLLAEISQRAGVRLNFRTAPDIPTFEERMKNGEYTIAYMNPYHYTVFSKQAGYRAFSREKGRKLVGIIVIHKNAPFRSLSELTGKLVAFPAPAAFAASILPRGEFSRQDIAIDARFVNSHDSVYRGVAQGTFAAGGGIKRTLEAMDPAIASQLRILATTPAYVPHAFAAHANLPEETLNKIVSAMQSLDKDDVGRHLLEPLSFKGIEPAIDKDWDEIRQLRITLPVGKASASDR